MDAADLDRLKAWIGRRTQVEDDVTQRLVDGYRATFAPHLAPVGAAEAPLGCHWCLTPTIAPMSELGPDGHPAKGLLLPPVPLPRRMWAGGELETLAPLRVGDHVTRKSTIADIALKQGRSGSLCFFTIRHEFSTARGLAIRERQDLVFREAASPGAAPPQTPPPGRPASHASGVDPTPVMLFRYSAITFNGHRIHYDEPYATKVEGYEGLVVHGPLQATLLLNLAAVIGGRAPLRFAYRALAPLIGGRRFEVRGRASDGAIDCWTAGPSGQMHMQAEAR